MLLSEGRKDEALQSSKISVLFWNFGALVCPRFQFSSSDREIGYNQPLLSSVLLGIIQLLLACLCLFSAT
jgi:hypothetical protein